MRAVVITAPGGPEVLQIEEVDAPSLRGPHDVLVDVHAAGLNRADVLQRRGFYPPPPDVDPRIPGLEFAGVVASIGPAVSRFSPGDRVMGLLGGAAQAERVVTHERELLRIPEGLSMTDAAAIPEVFTTAFDALFLQAKLVAGERVYITAVGSGVGTAALQLAKHAGAVCFGSSRTPEKLERARALGLDHPLLADGAPMAPRVLDLTDRRGVDVVIDFLGAGALPDHLGALALKGRMVTLGLLQGVRGELNLVEVLKKRLTLIGSTLRSRAHEERAELCERVAQEVAPRFNRGDLKPIVDSILPLAEVREAHRRLEQNHAFGKLVLTLR